MYYINGRYYEDEVGQFITPDYSSINPLVIGGLNPYGLGVCNPLMFGVNGYNCFTSLPLVSDEESSNNGWTWWNNLPNWAKWTIGSVAVIGAGALTVASLGTAAPALTALGIGVAIGAGAGAVAYTASELISLGITGKFSWSWGMFAGSIIGGAIGGAASMVPGIGIMSSAFITGLTSTYIGMGLETAFGEANHSAGGALITSFAAGGISALTARVMEKIRIPGLNAGRGSLQQISRQITTKFARHQISRIAGKTFAKMFAYSLYNSTLSTFANGFLDAFGFNDWVDSWF